MEQKKNSSDVDFGKVAEQYAKWNHAFPVEAFDRLVELGVLKPEHHVVDLGAGSGMASRALTKRGMRVTGVEPAKEMILAARTYDMQEGLSIFYIHASVEQTGLPDHSFDAAVIVRSWHWFDRKRAIAEVKRIVKPGGYLIVMDAYFLTEEHELLKETKEIVQNISGKKVGHSGSKQNVQHFIHGFPAEWHEEWKMEGLAPVDHWQYRFAVRFTYEGWRGRVQALSWLTVMTPEERRKVDRELDTLLQTKYKGKTLELPHLCSSVVWKLEEC